jgi:replication-associated recombination protein RarA
MQKAIRRGDAGIAVYFTMELWPKYSNLAWKRLHIISAEDVAGCITQEVRALHEAYLFINKGKGKMDDRSGRLFLSKAAILLSVWNKSRDCDHAIVYLFDRKYVSDDEAQAYLAKLDEGERLEIPDYAYDCHTHRGKRAGKTVEDFLVSEFEGLKPRVDGLFDHLVDPQNRKKGLFDEHGDSGRVRS